MSLDECRIGVIMGGCSSEREISLKSGRAVLKALQDKGLNVFGLDVQKETEEEIRRLVLKDPLDVVFVAMHGGFGEDGRLQAILEKIGVDYTGPGKDASERAMDKIVSRKFFRQAGLHVPPCVILKKNQALPFLSRWMSYPRVVKPAAEGSSIGISFVKNSKGLRSALEEAFRYGEAVLMEEFIAGRELTVSVLDARPLPVVEIKPKKGFFDFESKYQKGMTEYLVPAPLDKDLADKVQKAAVAAYHTLGCRHQSRVDVILRGSTPYILEVNTIPGMTETSLFPKAAAAAGMEFGDLCCRLIEMAIQNRLQATGLEGQQAHGSMKLHRSYCGEKKES